MTGEKDVGVKRIANKSIGTDYLVVKVFREQCDNKNVNFGKWPNHVGVLRRQPHSPCLNPVLPVSLMFDC